MNNGISEADERHIQRYASSRACCDIDAFSGRVLSAVNARIHHERSVSVDEYNPDLTEWVERETHYCLDRIGYEWDENERRFNGVNDFIYSSIRFMVLRAVVDRAVDFFNGEFPKSDSSLRGSLKRYLSSDSSKKIEEIPFRISYDSAQRRLAEVREWSKNARDLGFIPGPRPESGDF